MTKKSYVDLQNSKVSTHVILYVQLAIRYIACLHQACALNGILHSEMCTGCTEIV